MRRTNLPASNLEFVFGDTRFSCIICGKQEWRQYQKLGRYSVLRCQNCGVGQTYPRPPEKDIIEGNQSIYTAKQREPIYKKRAKELTNRYNRFLSEIENLQVVSEKKILDVGCGMGFFLSVAKENGYDTYGVELSQEMVEYARTQLALTNIYSGTLGTIQLPEKYFDIITLWDVLEHISDPQSFLKDVSEFLKDEGILAVQSPNMNSSMALLTGENWYWWTVPDHLFHFTPLTMGALLRSSGFDVIKSYTWESAFDFWVNLAGNISTKITYQNSLGRLARKMIHIVSQNGWPIVVPFQHRLWQKGKGGLIVQFAQKRKTSS